MTAASVGIDQNRRGSVENAFVFGPTVGHCHGLNAGRVIEAFLQQQATGTMLVIARTVTGPAGHQHDLLVSGAAVDAYDRCRRQPGKKQRPHFANGAARQSVRTLSLNLSLSERERASLWHRRREVAAVHWSPPKF